MDLDQALAELGLDPAGDHDQESIRRAYLKLVKQRKPETDPEGFRRLREAYDLLRAAGPVVAWPLAARSQPALAEPQLTLPDPFSVAAEHLAQGQPDLAVNAIAAALPGEHPDQYWYLYQQGLQFVLDLHRRDLVGPASRLFAAIKASLGGKGPTAGPLNVQLGLLYLVCSELDAIPTLPITFRQGVALILLNQDPAASYATVRDYERGHGSLPTRRWRTLLHQRAPTLASLFHWYHEPSLFQRLRRSRAAMVIVGIVLVVVVIQWIDGMPAAPPVEPASPAIPEGMSLLAFCAGTGAEGREEEGQLAARTREPLCTWVQMVNEALRRGQCLQAHRFLDGLQRQTSGYVPRVRQEVEPLAARVVERCPPGAVSAPI